MKSLLLIGFLATFATPTNADMQSLLDNWKAHNEQVMDLKKNPQKYGLAPKGFYEIQYAAVTLQMAKSVLNCNAKNRKLCSNQLAQKD